MGYKQNLLTFQTTYHANGKLILTGEYLVLHGAKAIALPLNVGQKMIVSGGKLTESIVWKAIFNNQIWFSCELNPLDFSILKSTDPEKAETLKRLFATIKILKPDFRPEPGTSFETVLESNPEWGFGSSSTLVSLLSQFADVDPFKLNDLVFKGSGFDIACATANGPFFYTKNGTTQPINLDFPFSNQLFLLYSGRKKKTANEVSSFLKDKKPSDLLIRKASGLSDEFARCRDRNDFDRLIENHEELTGALLGKTPVKKEHFADFPGAIKSLGAWGGDFYLVSTELSLAKVNKYFEPKGLTTVFRWDELILKRKA